MRTVFLLLFGLTLASSAVGQQSAQDDEAANEAAQQRERAIERCNSERGTDCETEAGLREWLLQERSRDEAEAQGSRSIHQTAPVPAPRPSN